MVKEGTQELCYTSTVRSTRVALDFVFALHRDLCCPCIEGMDDFGAATDCLEKVSPTFPITWAYRNLPNA